MKRRFRLGPATTLALAGAVVVAYVRFPQWQREAEQSRQLEAVRAEVARRGAAKPVPPHDLDALWSARERLALSAAQQTSLAALRAQEASSTAALQRETGDAARDFSAWLKEHQSGATMSDIQSHAAFYSQKSGDLASARREFWNRGLAVLTPAQRAQLDTQIKP